MRLISSVFLLTLHDTRTATAGRARSQGFDTRLTVAVMNSISHTVQCHGFRWALSRFCERQQRSAHHHTSAAKARSLPSSTTERMTMAVRHHPHLSPNRAVGFGAGRVAMAQQHHTTCRAAREHEQTRKVFLFFITMTRSDPAHRRIHSPHTTPPTHPLPNPSLLCSVTVTGVTAADRYIMLGYLPSDCSGTGSNKVARYAAMSNSVSFSYFWING